MKDIIKILIGGLVMFKIYLMLMSGSIPLPKFISNTIDSKKMTDGDTILIVGVGVFSKQTILQVKNIIESTYNLPTKIGQPIKLETEYYINGAIDTDKILSEFDDNQNKIIITNEKCFSKNLGIKVGGQAELYGNIVIIGKNKSSSLKRVLIHEIGHNLGLRHCENVNCLMYEYRDNDINLNDFCDECKKSL